MNIKEFGNSINKILNERLTSPFYGSLIVSWLLINWKIVYLTLFIDSEEIEGNKIDYIVDNYSSYWSVFVFPIISAIILITLIPFVTNRAYSLSLFFSNKRREKKLEVEKSQVLTVEQSLQIRAEIQNQKVEFNKLLDEKNNEIKLLEIQIESQKDNSIIENAVIDGGVIDNIPKKENIVLEVEILEKLKVSNFRNDFNNIKDAILKNHWIDKSDENFININSLGFLEAYGIIEAQTENTMGHFLYKFTEKGNTLLRVYYNTY